MFHPVNFADIYYKTDEAITISVGRGGDLYQEESNLLYM